MDLQDQLEVQDLKDRLEILVNKVLQDQMGNQGILALQVRQVTQDFKDQLVDLGSKGL